MSSKTKQSPAEGAVRRVATIARKTKETEIQVRLDLDGAGQLPHLDSLLSIEELKGIQWVPGDGAKPCTEWPEVYRKIRDTGKRIQIYGDLHGFDMPAIPCLFEQAVREPEYEKIPDRLLAKEVVDPEHLLLFERSVDDRVGRLCRGQIDAERFLDNEPGPPLARAQSARPDAFHGAVKLGWGNGEVEDSVS